MSENVNTSESEDEIEKVSKILKSRLAMNDNSSSIETSDAEEKFESAHLNQRKRRKCIGRRNHLYYRHQNLLEVFPHLRPTLN